MPRKAPAEMALAKGFAFVNNGLSRREALARQLDPQTLEEILKALVEKAKGCCVEKQVVDLRGTLNLSTTRSLRTRKRFGLF